MSEIELFRRFDCIPHPFTKVSVVDLTFSFRISVNDQGLNISEIQPLPKLGNDIVSCDKSILVNVKR
jgi:hypothetical protein